jgi:hypothetical protein
MAPVSKPLSSTKLHRLIYLLILLSTLLSAYYGFRVVQWKTEVGGWYDPFFVHLNPIEIVHHTGGTWRWASGLLS